MKLDTVKVLSQNADIKGKEFDVYYVELFGSLDLISVETPHDATNILSTLDEQSINDITASLKDLITSRNVRNILSQFTQEEISLAMANDSKLNCIRGHSND
jgi:hypothetical protein